MFAEDSLNNLLILIPEISAESITACLYCTPKYPGTLTTNSVPSRPLRAKVAFTSVKIPARISSAKISSLLP